MRLTTFILFGLMAITATAQPSAKDIVTRADAKMRGESSYQEITMEIVRPKWQRTISMKVWSKGRDYALIKITAPAKDKDAGYLKRKNELWNWRPSIDRMIKMSSSVMGQSWMDSDFTNDDMVRESSIVFDYSHRLLGEEKIREFNCYKIELIPLENAAVVWGKVIVWIDKTGYNIVRSENYDEAMELAQTSEGFDLKTFGDRSILTRTELTPADKKGFKTIMVVDKAQFNQPIADTFFSQQNLKTIR